MTLDQAIAHVGTLAIGSTFTFGDRVVEIMSISCGGVEFAPVEHKSITQTFQRINAGLLAEAFQRGDAT